MIRHEALEDMIRGCKSFLLELIDERAAELVGETGDLDEGAVEALLEELNDYLLEHIDEPSLIRSAPELVDVLLWETLPFRPWLAMMEFGSRPSVGAVLAWVITDWASRATFHDLAEELTDGVASRVVGILLTLTEPSLPRLS
jgi:hypothetical protein